MKDLSLKMIEKYNWPFESYFDHERALMGKFTDAVSVPQTFILDSDFAVVFSKSGASLQGGTKDAVESMMKGEFENVRIDIRAYEKKLYSLGKRNLD